MFTDDANIAESVIETKFCGLYYTCISLSRAFLFQTISTVWRKDNEAIQGKTDVSVLAIY